MCKAEYLLLDKHVQPGCWGRTVEAACGEGLVYARLEHEEAEKEVYIGAGGWKRCTTELAGTEKWHCLISSWTS